jgi:hypothetical protein
VTFEGALTFFSLALFVAALILIVMVVREVLPHLHEQDRMLLERWVSSGGEIRYNINGPLKRAWNEHCRLFPQSRKRILFACLLIAASLSVMAFPLWIVFR